MKPSDYHSKLRCNRENIFAPDSYMSKSVLWELNTASLYKWRYHTAEKKVTDSMQWGTLIDCLTTSLDEFSEQFAVSEYSDFRTKAAQEWKKSTQDSGKVIITSDTLDEAKEATRMLTECHPIAKGIFEKSSKQQIVCAEILGVKFKGLVDLAPEGEDFLADLKTTSKFSLDGFSRQMSDYGYHVQAGLYLALWNAMHPNDQRNRFKIIWQDSNAPYEVAVTEIDEDEIAQGYRHAMHLLGKLIEATENDYWPMQFESNEPTIYRHRYATLNEDF